MRDTEEPFISAQVFERVKNSSMAIVTPLAAEWVFAALPSDAKNNDISIVLDEDYLNEFNTEQKRYFIVCPNHAAYSAVYDVMLSRQIIAQPKIRSSYWKHVAAKVQRGEVCLESPSIPSAPRDAVHIPAWSEGTAVYAIAQMDVVTTIISMFPERPLIAWTNANNALGLAGVPAPPHNHHLGPTGQKTCLPKILAHSRRWTPKAAHRARRMASQEVKSLARSFRQKYQGLVHACSNNTRINFTLDDAMAIINSIQDRKERKKWVVAQIREMDKFNKDVDVMLSEYCAIMSHFQSLQNACIAAVNEAYNVHIVIIPINFFPAATLSS